jgi:hypothetical protein
MSIRWDRMATRLAKGFEVDTYVLCCCLDLYEDDKCEIIDVWHKQTKYVSTKNPRRSFNAKISFRVRSAYRNW